jgi:hypothetical protein
MSRALSCSAEALQYPEGCRALLSDRKISCIITCALIYFRRGKKGHRLCSQFADAESYFMRGAQLYGVTISSLVLTHHTLVALLFRRSL